MKVGKKDERKRETVGLGGISICVSWEVEGGGGGGGGGGVLDRWVAWREMLKSSLFFLLYRQSAYRGVGPVHSVAILFYFFVISLYQQSVQRRDFVHKKGGRETHSRLFAH